MALDAIVLPSTADRTLSPFLRPIAYGKMRRVIAREEVDRRLQDRWIGSLPGRHL